MIKFLESAIDFVGAAATATGNLGEVLCGLSIPKWIREKRGGIAQTTF